MKYIAPEWDIIHFNLTDVLVISIASPNQGAEEKEDFESEGIPIIL